MDAIEGDIFMFNPGLKIGQIIKNADIVEIFKCENMGGMRRSRTTNTMEKLVSLQERIDGRKNKVSVYYSRDGLFQKECSPRAGEFRCRICAGRCRWR